jgi:hypothetical protein
LYRANDVGTNARASFVIDKHGQDVVIKKISTLMAI